MSKFFLAIGLLISFVQCQAQPSAQQSVITTVDKNQFKQLLLDTTYILLDVRTPEEFNEGHLKGAKNIDVEADSFEQLINKINPDQPVLIYCRTGKRSMTAAGIMEKNNFVKIINLKGGYEAWVED